MGTREPPTFPLRQRLSFRQAMLAVLDDPAQASLQAQQLHERVHARFRLEHMVTATTELYTEALGRSRS